MKNLSMLKKRPIAHGGIFDNVKVYENTINAFDAAIRLNAIIQLDIRLLKDGTIVVFQDEELMRLHHVEGIVSNLTYEELSYISKYQIPTLEMVLELVHGKVPLIIDIKTKTKRGIFEQKVKELLDNYSEEVCIQSSNIKTVKWFYKNGKNYIIGYLLNKNNYKRDYLFKSYDFINVDISLYDSKKIKKLRENKMVLGYTIHNKQEYEKVIGVYDNLAFANLLEMMDILDYNNNS